MVRVDAMLTCGCCSLSDNYIGAEGGKLIAQALKQNTSLVRLE